MIDDTPPPQLERSGNWAYAVLLVFETFGATLILREGLPIYRKTLADPNSFDHKTTGIALGGAILIQIAYWTRHRIRARPPRVVNVVLAQMVLFLARLVFILPAAIFSYLFIAKTALAEIPTSKYAFIIFALFSLSCFVHELESLGAALESTSLAGDPN